MTESETENWRLSDAPDGAKHRVESVTANGSASPHLGNSAQDTEPLPAVEIHYPKSIEDDTRAYKSREERREQWRLILEALTVVAILAFGALAYRQWHTAPDRRSRAWRRWLVDADEFRAQRCREWSLPR
jgi:hypothetical protein